jgi:Homeodomain-like domain
MRPADERDEVLRLTKKGLSAGVVAQATGIPRTTVRRWRESSLMPRPRRVATPWRPRERRAYCYVLGAYLGDGHIVVTGGSAFLRITLDAHYPNRISEVAAALGLLFPDRAVHRYRYGAARRVILQISSASLPAAFPQHGPGRKHLRAIRLEEWQIELTRSHPDALVRGLIHSDGCRSTNRFRTVLPGGRTATYEYARYFFSNLSGDIRRIFCDHCDLLGIRWSQSNERNISIANRKSVEMLDRFVGPKT